MTERRLEELSKVELIQELTKLEEADRRLRSRSGMDPDRLLHDLQVHEIELEMQNRQLIEALYSDRDRV